MKKNKKQKEKQEGFIAWDQALNMLYDVLSVFDEGINEYVRVVDEKVKEENNKAFFKHLLGLQLTNQHFDIAVYGSGATRALTEVKKSIENVLDLINERRKNEL